MQDTSERQEYPKMLYQGGAVRTEEGRPVPPHHTRTVATAEEEAEARDEGFTDASAPEATEVAEVTEETEQTEVEQPEPTTVEQPEPVEAEQPETAEQPEA